MSQGQGRLSTFLHLTTVVPSSTLPPLTSHHSGPMHTTAIGRKSYWSFLFTLDPREHLLIRTKQDGVFSLQLWEQLFPSDHQ